jgi:hypothetical protein
VTLSPICHTETVFGKSSMAEPLKEPLEFVFVWWSDDDHGVILSRAYHTLVVRFHAARRTAGTWGEFLSMLGDSADYLEDFMEHDETEPQDSDRLEDLHGVWVLEDVEFPLTQSAQESFEFYGHHFPQCDGTLAVRTEYGMLLRLYPKSAYLGVKSLLTEAGHRVSEEMATFPMTICQY